MNFANPREVQRRRMLILGAGIYQVPLIERAKKMGLETHVVSYAGDFPGITLADHYYEFDTTDISGVLALAERIKPAGIVTSGTDVAVPTVGAVCDALSLSGISRKVAETISTKDAFRTFQQANRLRAPRFAVIDTHAELPGVLARMPVPLIFKPVDSSGSRGIVRVEKVEDGLAAFERAQRYSRRGRICIEEVLPGVEVGGNALLHEGEIVFLAITAKHMEGFIVRGHSYPCTISVGQQAAVRSEIKNACARLGYRSGALNFDVMVHGTEATVIELGARLGGNGLTDLITHAFAYDIEADVLRLALGDSPKVSATRAIRPCGSWVFGSTRAGRLERISRLAELKAHVPHAYAVSNTHAAGASVRPLVHNGNQLGYVLFAIPAGETWQSISRMLAENFVLDVREEAPNRCAFPDAAC